MLRIWTDRRKTVATYMFLDVVITDDAAQAEYKERAPGVIEAYGGRILARGDVVESTDGELTSRRRLTVLEFDNLEQAKAYQELCQGSPDQLEIREIRGRMGTVNSINIVEGDI